PYREIGLRQSEASSVSIGMRNPGEATAMNKLILAGIVVAVIGCGGGKGDGGGSADGGGGTTGAAGGGGTAGCTTGSEGCACYGNDTCNGALQCFSHLCVSVTGTGGSVTGSGGSATGSGGSTGAGGAGTGAGGAGTGTAGTSGGNLIKNGDF